MLVGSLSLDQLGLAEIVTQARAVASPPERSTLPGIFDRQSERGETTAFLVNRNGRIIYHPDSAQIGQDLREHEGVAAVIQGQSGATYHQEPNGQELVVGYAPVAGPGWGLNVQWLITILASTTGHLAHTQPGKIALSL